MDTECTPCIRPDKPCSRSDGWSMAAMPRTIRASRNDPNPPHPLSLPSWIIPQMSGNTLGTLFAVTNFGESHGPAIGCVIDGCPPGMALSEADIQHDLDRRRPGTSRHVTQRQEPDQVQILSGVYQGVTTGAPIALLIQNTDQRSQDYGDILQTFRPGHADYTYLQKYGLRDPRSGGRSSARLTAPTVAAGAVPQKSFLRIYGTTLQRGMTRTRVHTIAFVDGAHLSHKPR